MQEVVRGCGTRVKGGLYAETLLGENGFDLNYFLVDEPKVIDPSMYGVSKVGVTVIEINGTFHILDWIGEQYYGLPADFIEEVRRFGLSRRLPKNSDMKKLSKDSKIFLVHSKANIINPSELRGGKKIKCMCNKPEHNADGYKGCCSSLLYHANGKDVSAELHKLSNSEKVEVSMPSFRYTLNHSQARQRYGDFPAIFLALPIHNLAVIKDDIGFSHTDILDEAESFNTEVILKDS